MPSRATPTINTLPPVEIVAAGWPGSPFTINEFTMPQRIASHKPPRLPSARRRDDSNRPNATERGYCTKAHRAWRRAVLTRDAWQCRACGRICSDKREAQADHVVPIAQGGDRYDVANGQTLCITCHSRKTRAENSGRATSPTTTVAPSSPAAWPEYR